jgi:hypothetical protein
MTENEIFDDVAVLVRELTRDGANYFKGAIDKSQLRLTDELYDSVQGIVIREAEGLGMEAQFFFKKWWRLKDMKQLNYSNSVSFKGAYAEAMTDFVESIDLNDNVRINGYENRAVPTVPNARIRFRNTLIAYRKKVPVVKHDTKRRLYNKTKSQYLNVLKRRMAHRLSKKIPIFMKDVLEAE